MAFLFPPLGFTALTPQAVIRGQKVMVDFDLAMLYGVKNKRLNEQVKRNIKRFPDDFMFQLTNEEWTILKSQITAAKQFENKAITLLRSQIATTKDVSKIRTLPYAFTRNGIGMLSSVLGSDTAVEMNIRQLNSFSCLIGIMIVFSLSMMTFISWVQVLKILVQVSVL